MEKEGQAAITKLQGHNYLITSLGKGRKVYDRIIFYASTNLATRCIEGRIVFRERESKDIVSFGWNVFAAKEVGFHELDKQSLQWLPGFVFPCYRVIPKKGESSLKWLWFLSFKQTRIHPRFPAKTNDWNEIARMERVEVGDFLWQ
ncbi:hypothetical protein [Brevibacillus nitrificans]|uniref:hypothetical protein n=1 Tax=Brevibacillus nitrificans TaxID=651560 RepID=UPI00263230B4|nr:hypothetical protein [Brevibacillus nitrificans]